MEHEKVKSVQLTLWVTFAFVPVIISVFWTDMFVMSSFFVTFITSCTGAFSNC